MSIANIGDIDVYYEQEGEGEPVLLAPPSWWPSDTWKVAVVPFLSKRYRTITFDCRGTGYSSKPDGGYTVEQFAKDCAGLLAHLKVARCHAVGFALGGQIVQSLAIQQPELVATLTIAAAGAGTKATSGGPRALINSDEEEIRAHGFER
ncbi:MAG TPA: alpha/beta hydrolase, partial [Candidatus Binatia bacterium]|nr:alpha/beta hydrolase [Candidatus Binatia bacterium]